MHRAEYRVAYRLQRHRRRWLNSQNRGRGEQSNLERRRKRCCRSWELVESDLDDDAATRKANRRRDNASCAPDETGIAGAPRRDARGTAVSAPAVIDAVCPSSHSRAVFESNRAIVSKIDAAIIAEWRGLDESTPVAHRSDRWQSVIGNPEALRRFR